MTTHDEPGRAGVYGLGLRFLLGEKDGEGYHLVHHLFPRTPMWRLREVDAILRQDPTYAALPQLTGLLVALGGIYRSLPERAGAAVVTVGQDR